MVLTVKSMTSGGPLIAEKIKECKIRKFVGLAHIRLNVHGSGLGRRVVKRAGWYREKDITEETEPERARVINIKQ